MCDRSYGSTSRPRDHSCSSLNRQDSISTLTFDDVLVPAPAASRIGDAGGRISPLALDLNEVGHSCNPHFGNPSWAATGVSGGCDHGGGRMGEASLDEFLLMNYDCVDVNGVNQPQVQQLNPFDHEPMMLQHNWMHHHQMMVMSSKLELADCSSENRVGGIEEGLDRFVPMSSGISVGSSCDSGMVTEKKRRCIDEVFDKTVERRKKRMIKNRESAARSRARKQAYTNHLETEVKRLQEANDLLRNEKEGDMMIGSKTRLSYQLRRTSSAHF
ncbi:hypothetical protein MLD38_033974 [Melastoma candidum]|uniref:Uncharacterized protein n=1 Tax=Melastoma candidum TaxID=119954 RepID=A0ACB9M8F2_9MYRT|nr:hypothetical protein MLD38_033974 [Melastoma candidum]